MDIRDLQSGRLREARSKRFPTAKAAIDAFGFVEPTYRSHENGGRAFDVEHALRYGKAFGADPVWLLGLAPEPASKPPSSLGAPALSGAASSAASGDDVVEIVSLDLSLSMGPGTLIEEFVEGEPVKMDLRLIQAITRTPSDRLRLVRGIGDSMEPTLRTGDRVMVDINERQLSRMNGIYWIDHLGTHGIKRLRAAGKGRVMVMSDNALIPPFEVDAGELRIEGRVIWFARDL